MRKLLLIPVTAVAVLVGLTLAASPAGAGGWAVSTLDAMPQPKAGEDVDVGFTMRQHGRTPVDVEDAGITTRSEDGTTAFWPARHDGPTGHYIATVRFPTAGTFTWEINQGWFGPQPLGTIEVPDGTGVPAPPAPAPKVPAPDPVTVVRHEPVQMPLAVRLLLPVVAIGAALVAAGEALHIRRARRAEQLAAA
jgi:hypothetical protein